MKERAEAAQLRNRYSLVYVINLAASGRSAGSAPEVDARNVFAVMTTTATVGGAGACGRLGPSGA